MFDKLHENSDALEAVKLDPAVLEAQVTVHAKNNAIANENVIDEKPNFEEEKEKEKVTKWPSLDFEQMESQHEAALLSLTPHQLELLMKYAAMLRKQRLITQRYLECAFCKNNGRPRMWYTSHILKDGRGRVQCPVLRRYRCPRCGATGDYAHTIKYCQDNSFIDTQSSCSDYLF